MSYAEERMQNIIRFEEINGPREVGGCFILMPLLGITITGTFLLLNFKEGASASAALCVSPSTILSIYILRKHLKHDQMSNHIMQNARNNAVPHLPYAYHKEQIKRSSSLSEFYEDITKELYKYDDEE